jgi:hypothetical protein
MSLPFILNKQLNYFHQIHIILSKWQRICIFTTPIKAENEKREKW